MGFRRLIGHLLAVFVIAGLVVAPLVSPVAAMGSSNVAMSDMASMADEMPCCPDTQKKNDCKDCPLLAICMLKNLVTQPIADAIVVRSFKHYNPAVHDDLISDGLDRPPPDHPPRTLV
ncbi:conserved hypothetical protein [Nitrobacter hamburgensis X14]|uniref:Uncharacterized protein n=1 Tax=Nitrobacter hamburgensis (strain DSM 10229 / NCIMB 13809 / X14) TaxID=323097 RepID=Q1QM82_NITHX|nr:hypothetical protein [Nitrobacter hamburgensis]ABE62665.1 conserved hypothetical protein [Nitrobacter hamburgensis X14]